MDNVLVVLVEVIVNRPPSSPLFRTVAPFFQTKVKGPIPEAVVLKLAVAPGQMDWSAGSVVCVTTTVSVAAVVVAVPPGLVNTARYWLPLSAKVAVNISVVLVAPEILVKGPPPVLTCHCTVGAGKPLAAAVKVAVWPSHTV